MDFLLSSPVDDLGYGSAEESDPLPAQDVPIPEPSQQLDIPPGSNVDREIAQYDQLHIPDIERADGETQRQHTKDLLFIPPHSNGKPRTSLQVQRHEEYSKPLYNISEDFRRMSFVKDSHHFGHVWDSLRSSSANRHGIQFLDQGQHSQGQHLSKASGASFDAQQFVKSPGRSHDLSSASSRAPSLRLMAAAASTSNRSSFLTPVQQRILTVVQIPHDDNHTEPMANSTDEKGSENEQEMETEMRYENENDVVMDSYDAVRAAGGSRVDRKGQHSVDESKDGMAANMSRRFGGLRKRKGDSKRVKTR